MFGLGFLAPAFLAGLAAVAVPIVLHLFRRRTDRVVDFPAVQMLPQAPVERQERRRLRDLLLLALRVTALVALAISFARPYVMRDGASIAAGSTIVAVDTSLSLSAPATWTDVRARARAAVDAAPAADPVGVVAFDDRGRVVVPPTVDRAQARAAIDGLTAGAGGTSFPAGLGAAVDALAGSRGRIVVVTDAQQRGWRGVESWPVPAGVEVSLVPVPVLPGNLAVTALRRDAALTAVVQSYATGPRRIATRLSVDGRELARTTVAVAPLSAAEVRFTAPLPAAGVAAITIEDPGGAPADDVRYWPLAPVQAPLVLVLTADPPASARTGLYAQRALEAAGELWPARVVVQDGRTYSAAAGETPAVVVVVGTRTLDRRGRDRLASYLHGGGRVLLSLGPDVDVPTLADTIGLTLRVAPDPATPAPEQAAIVPSDRRHPIWRQLAGSRSALGRLPIERYRPLLGDDGWTVLARFAGGAVALAERAVDRGTLLLFTSDLDNRWNRFPLEPGFAPFMVDTARYLTRDAGSTAAFVLPEVPPTVAPMPGPHVIPATDGRPATTVVVNVDPAESDPAVLSPEAFAAHVQPGEPAAPPAVDDRARAREEQQRLWQRGLLVMLALLVIESLVGRAGRGRPAAQTG